MKTNILFFLTTLGLTTTVLAQESLFPELSTEEEIEVVEEVKENPETMSNENKKGETDKSEVKVEKETKATEVSEVSSETTEDTEEEDVEEEEEERIYIALNNIKANITEVAAVSHCTADFILLNGFKKRTLNNFSVTLTIGSKEKQFDFKNVKPLGPAGKSFIMVGPVCEDLIKTPGVNVQKCQLQGLSEKKCKEKVQYMPIQQNN